ncbi:MAG: methyltransferase domain-containing protein [Candidatus Eisenbacteria bacterium]|uniref:Methyltransferase domain-containing protein n=1 Tax=Eiseniibacteriota bacterium TaxID=2212470 RepID=A0A948RZW4_UNCEI|nr:methyltransferase domain-containing protein [Candidatus Eisenbacteria bacterium]MBU1947568.1 methyltransferase domain-containing protein [Candidatus Eisenbacteria bacterium]MBU2692702.1 methyltransferase domain-containing protein [Candidatus Eisenbacteria bacterium]
MADRLGTGVLDRQVGTNDLLRSDVDYDRPPHGGKDLFNIVGDLSGKLILDLGCGLGIYRKHVEEKGGKWIGLDLQGDAPSVHGDGDQLPFADGVFDGVLCVAVFEHMPEPDRTLSEIRRVLSDGGILFGYTAFLEPFHGMSYFHMSHMGLEYLLLKYGFQPIRIFPSLIGPAFQIENLLFPRHIPFIQPAFRWLSQHFCTFLLLMNRFARAIMLRVARRPEAGDRHAAAQYRRLLDLRYTSGFIFTSRKVEIPASLPSGYAAFIKEG